MDLNDPFNRLSKQQHSEYVNLRESLRNGGVDNQAKADALLLNVRNRALKLSLITIVISAIIILFWIELKAIVIVFAVVILLWLLTNAAKSRRYLNRYISDEINKNSH